MENLGRFVQQQLSCDFLARSSTSSEFEFDVFAGCIVASVFVFILFFIF